MSDQSLPPAAWYADPQDPQSLRYWDGGAWTDQTRPLVPEPEVVAVQPAVQETVTVAEAGPVFAETVVDQPVAVQPAAPAVVDPLSGFAAEVSALSEPAVAPVPTPAVAPVATPAVTPVVPAAPAGAGADVVVVTTETLPGHRVVSVIGPVMGVAVRSHAELSEVASFGGFGPSDHAGLMQRTRADALDRLSAAAAEAGATAVIGVRIDAGDVAGTFTEVSAYGTAVVTTPG